MDFEQPNRDVNSVIRFYADQVGIEGGMMDFGFWQTVSGPEPAEEPLPGTVKGMGIEVGIKARLRIRHRPDARPERLREQLCDLPSTPTATAGCRSHPWMRKSSYDSRSSRMALR